MNHQDRIQNIDESEVAVLRNVTKFPVYNQEYALPNLAVFINERGNARVLYDKHEVVFKKNQVAVVLPHHLLCPLESSDDFCISMVVMSSKFVDELKRRTLSHDYNKFHLSPQTQLTEQQIMQVMRVLEVTEMIYESTVEAMPNRHEMLMYMSDIALEFINSFRQNQDVANKFATRNNVLFNDFCDLLAKHYCESREVIFYAKQLNLTPKYFSKIIYDTIGVTASEWIDEFVITNAKNMLATRVDLTIQQVANELGFDEQASFCRFFKRITGLTPKQFRKQC